MRADFQYDRRLVRAAATALRDSPADDAATETLPGNGAGARRPARPPGGCFADAVRASLPPASAAREPDRPKDADSRRHSPQPTSESRFRLLEPDPVHRRATLAERLSRARLVTLAGRRTPWHWIALTFFLALAPPDRTVAAVAPVADAEMPVQPARAYARVQTGSLLLRADGGLLPAPRIDTDARIEVSGIAARVRMVQRFRNEEDSWVEGVYVFPLPDRAAVDHLRMRIGERLIEGEIRERTAAKREYEQARSEGRRAGLVEQERPNLFTASVANIAPGETIEIEIEYQETVAYRDGAFSLRLPLTLTPRYIPGAPPSGQGNTVDRRGSGWSADTGEVPDASRVTPPMIAGAADHRLRLAAVIDAGVPLAAVKSRYHPVSVTPPGGGPGGAGAGAEVSHRYEITLADGDVPLDHDFELVWRPAASGEPLAAVFRDRRAGEEYLLAMLLPPDAEAVSARAVPPRELILVIDASGSMHGNSIEQARIALRQALVRLRPEDRFNVIQFNSIALQLFPRPQPASPEAVRRAIAHVERLTAQGGTEMGPALVAALAGAPPEGMLRQVIFVTDGSVGNEASLFRLIEERLGAGRLFTVGIGSAPNGWFMRKAAETGRGSYTLVGARHEVRERMESLFRRLETPVLTDVELYWPDGTSPAVYPAIPPDLYAGEPVVLSAKLDTPLSEGALLAFTGSRAGARWYREIPLDGRPSYDGVSVLWARARIEALQDSLRAGADADEVRGEIVAVALGHHVVSPHTSLVAVDKTPARPAGEPLTSRNVPNLMAHGQSAEAIFGFPVGATSAPLSRLAGVALLLLGLAALVASRVQSLGGAARAG